MNFKQNDEVEDIDWLDNNSDSNLYICFYKENYRLTSRLIKWWTNSQYSHVEGFITAHNRINDYDYLDCGVLIGISSDADVRQKYYKDILNSDKWDIIKIPLEDKEKVFEALKEVYYETEGSKYDWKGIILSNFFNRRKHDKKKYTCSEWIITVLDKAYGDINPKWYNLFTPQDVYEYLSKKVEVK